MRDTEAVYVGNCCIMIKAMKEAGDCSLLTSMCQQTRLTGVSRIFARAHCYVVRTGDRHLSWQAGTEKVPGGVLRPQC